MQRKRSYAYDTANPSPTSNWSRVHKPRPRACVWVFVCVGGVVDSPSVCVTVFICMMLCVGASARCYVAENTIINNVFKGVGGVECYARVASEANEDDWCGG